MTSKVWRRHNLVRKLLDAKHLGKGSQLARFVTIELKNGIQEKYAEAFHEKTAFFGKITVGFWGLRKAEALIGVLFKPCNEIIANFGSEEIT